MAADVSNSSKKEDIQRLYELAGGICRLTHKENIEEAKGTGFLVGPTIIMTCNHVIPDKETARAYCAHFYHRVIVHQEEGGKTRAFYYSTLELDPDKLFIHSPQKKEKITVGNKEIELGQPASEGYLDYTIVALKTHSILKKFQNSIFSLVSGSSTYSGMTTHLFQHPEVVDPSSRLVGDFKQATGSFREGRDNEYEIHYSTPSAEGSSGGAVVDSQGNLLALHYRGEVGNCSHRPFNAKDFPFCNAGVSIDKILKSLSEEDLGKVKKHCPEFMESKPIDETLSFLENPSITFQDPLVQKELELANKFAEEARQAIEAYLYNKIPLDFLQKKMQAAFESYQEITENYEEEKDVTREVTRQIALLTGDLHKALFFYGRVHCMRGEFQGHLLIKQIEDQINSRDSQILDFLQKKLSFHERWVSKRWTKRQEELEISENMEARLFLIAIISELLENREAALKGYFQLAKYHSIAASRDETVDHSFMIQACLAKARGLETPKEKATKEHLIHREFAEILRKVRTAFDYDPFSCFISYDDVSKKTEEWALKFLYRDLITLNIRPIFRAKSQEVGQHEVDYGRKIRDARVALVLCTPQMKQKYEDYLRGVVSHAQFGIELEFLKDRYQSGKDLHNTYHLQLNKGWHEVAFSNLPPFFQRKNLVNLSEKSSAPYSKNLGYFENAIHLFCDLLDIPEHLKGNYQEEFLKFVSDIERRPVAPQEHEIATAFSKSQEMTPPLPLLPDPSKNSTRLIGVPNIGRDFQEREGMPLDALFKRTNRRLLTQDPSILCGTGKTYLAAQYAYQFGGHYSHVIWLDGKNKETLKDSFDQAIERIQKQALKVENIPSFIQWVEDTPGVLLIFDHIAGPEEIHQYLPNPQSSAHVLMTTRNPKWPAPWEVTSLGLFTPNEGTNLLTRITQKQEDQYALKIVESLEGIPSLISQAGYLLKGTHDAPKLYRTIMKSENAAKRRNLAIRSNLPSGISIHFARRQVHLAAVGEHFASTPSSTMVLTGDPGVGKTAIAHQYALENVHQFKRIWNLPCSHLDKLKGTIAELKIRLGMPLEKQEKDIVSSLKEIYQTIAKQEGKILLIFDDLSIKHRDLLPTNGIADLSILITSQDRDWNERSLPVMPFSRIDAHAILKQFLENKETHFLASHHDLFMGSPLALLQAAHTIKRVKIDPEIYLDALAASTREKRDLQTLFAALWKETEKTLLQGSKVNGEVCVSLAKLCACSPDQQATKERLMEWLEKTLKEILDPEEDPIHIVLRDYLTELSKFFLIEEREGFVFMEPLIAEGVRSCMKEEGRLVYQQLKF